MALKPKPPGSWLSMSRRGSGPCQDCGMRLIPTQPRFVHPTEGPWHAFTNDCIEGHGDDPEWGPDSAQQMLERGPR